MSASMKLCQAKLLAWRQEVSQIHNIDFVSEDGMVTEAWLPVRDVRWPWGVGSGLWDVFWALLVDALRSVEGVGFQEEVGLPTAIPINE